MPKADKNYFLLTRRTTVDVYGGGSETRLKHEGALFYELEDLSYEERLMGTYCCSFDPADDE
jgi:hypothetical protein